MTPVNHWSRRKIALNQIDEVLVRVLLYILYWQSYREQALDKRFRILAAIATALLVHGCGEKSADNEKPVDGATDAVAAPLLTAATLGEQTVLSVAEYLSAAPYSTADRTNGANQAQVCRACHSLDKGGPNMIGPALHGFFGSSVGSREGFEYSPVVRDADFIWTPRALDAWLAQPGRFLPGNRMTFAGVLRSSDRDDLIAFLLEATTTDGGT